MIEVRIPTLLQQMYGAPPAIAVDAETPFAAIAALEQRWSGMGDRILESDGALRPYLLLFVDGDYATLTTPLRDGAQVRIVPSIAGGEHGSNIAVDRSGPMDGAWTEPAQVNRATQLSGMLRANLAVEEDTIRRYKERAGQAGQVGEVALKVELENLLTDEIRHADELRRVMEGM